MGWNSWEYGQFRRRVTINGANHYKLQAFLLRLMPQHRVDTPTEDVLTRGAVWDSAPITIPAETSAILKSDNETIKEFTDKMDFDSDNWEEENDTLSTMYEKTHLLAMTDKFTSEPAKGGSGYYCDAKVTVVEYIGGRAVFDFNSGMRDEEEAVEGLYEWFSNGRYGAPKPQRPRLRVHFR
jgi:hypothetical protein